jgi:multidrug efflux pump subunit AcrA (membrane-fusion protein)
MKIKSLIFLLLIAAIMFSCKPKKTENLEEMARRSAHPEAVVVKTFKLEKSTFYHELISNGKIFSEKKAVVPFRINGIINSLLIQNGQKVKEGDLLAVIDDFDYKTALLRARQGLEKAEINFKDDLLGNFSTDDSTGLPAPKIKISRIRSGLNEAIIALSQAENNFNNTRVIAPLSGVVANLEAKQWNPSQNYKNLCTIINDETLEVEFPVIESEYTILENGMPVGIIPFVNDSTVITGHITQINPQVDENGMVRVKASFHNTGKLIDGMNVKVLIKKPVPNRLVVPKEALVIRQGKDVIFIRQDSLAIWKYVTVEFENSTSISVKEGLQPGDLVIVSGNINLAHETIVKEK